MARALKNAPEARLLRELSIDEVAGRNDAVTAEDMVPSDEHTVALWPLTNAPSLANVRNFRLGPDQGDDYRMWGCYLHTKAVADVVRQMPRVEELHLFANRCNLNDIFRSPTLSHVRILQVYHCFQVHRLQLLTENPAVQNLTHLLIHPHHVGAWWQSGPLDEADGYRREDGYLPLSVVTPLLQSPQMAKLQHIRLRCSSIGDAGCRAIVDSGILRRLKSLDLRHGAITDEGASTLAGCPDLRKLKWLDLDRNRLDKRGIARLKRTGIPMRIDEQQNQRERVEVGGDNHEYLCEGESE